MIRAWLMPVSLLLLATCREPEQRTAQISTVDSAGRRITSIKTAPSALPVWLLATTPSLALTGAETGDSAAFAQIEAARWLSDGRIVVADAAGRRLLLFDSNGKFVRALGRAGEGPAEFRHVASMRVVAGDSLVTFDASLRRLTVWLPDRGYVRSVRVGGSSHASWPADAWFWPRGRIVVLQLSVTPRDSIAPGGGVRRWPMVARLTLQDSARKALAESPPFDAMYTGIYEGGDTRLPFSNQPFAALSRDRVYFGSGSSFSLSYLNAEFGAEGELRWPANREELSGQEVAAVKAEAMALAAGRLPPEQLAKRFEMNFAPQILPKERPAIGRVFVDEHDNLWVERFEATRLGSRVQKAGDLWTVLSKEGLPIARLKLPGSTRLEDVKSSRALLVVRDSMDVQSIAVREIVKR